MGNSSIDETEMARGKQIVRVLVTLAVTFGVALVLNWGILGFFGQKSADRAEHSLVGTLLLPVSYTHLTLPTKRIV